MCDQEPTLADGDFSSLQVRRQELIGLDWIGLSPCLPLNSSAFRSPRNGVDKLLRLFEGHTGEGQLDAEQSMNLYTTIYNMCTQKRHKHLYSKHLYYKYTDSFSAYINDKVRPSLVELHNEELLKELYKWWGIHKLVVRRLSHVFHYLDRCYTLRHSLPSLKSAGLICFKDLVYTDIHKKAKDAVITLINRERDGELVDCVLIKNIVGFFIEVGVGSVRPYQQDFEQHLLTESAAFYKRKAAKIMQQRAFRDYISMAEADLSAEAERAERYLPPTTKSKLLHVVELELLMPGGQRREPSSYGKVRHNSADLPNAMGPVKGPVLRLRGGAITPPSVRMMLAVNYTPAAPAGFVQQVEVNTQQLIGSSNVRHEMRQAISRSLHGADCRLISFFTSADHNTPLPAATTAEYYTHHGGQVYARGMADWEPRVERLEGHVHALRGDVKSLQGNVKTLQEDLGAVRRRIPQLEADQLALYTIMRRDACVRVRNIIAVEGGQPHNVPFAGWAVTAAQAPGFHASFQLTLPDVLYLVGEAYAAGPIGQGDAVAHAQPLAELRRALPSMDAGQQQHLDAVIRLLERREQQQQQAQRLQQQQQQRR